MKAKHKDDHSLAEEKQACDIDKISKQRKLQDERAQVYVIQEKASASTSKQLSLEETFSIGKKWDSKHPEQVEGEKLLTYWLCDGLKSYETVENEHFQNFVNHLSKRFKVPSEKLLRNKLVPELNDKVQYVVKKSLEYNSAENRTYRVTTDIWSSPSRDSFMSINSHWINNEFQRKLVILRCIRYNTAH